MSALLTALFWLGWGSTLALAAILAGWAVRDSLKEDDRDWTDGPDQIASRSEAAFLAAIRKASPNGERTEVCLYPDGLGWSVYDRPTPPDSGEGSSR